MTTSIYRNITTLFSSIFLGFVLVLSGCTPDGQNDRSITEKPHILLILVDDMGYGDLKSYNPDSKISTPNLDELANEGMRFMNAHAPGAVCHPSRYGLLTGRYPFRTNVNVWPEQPVIDEDRMTIASLLKSEGYHTAMVGKWHLGFDESAAIQASREHEQEIGNNTRAAYRQYEDGQILSGGPVDRGFDSFFGIRASTGGSSDQIVREFVLNAIDSLDDESQKIKDAVIAMAKRTDGLQWTHQDHRIVLHLLDEWNIEAEDVGLEIDMGFMEFFSR